MPGKFAQHLGTNQTTTAFQGVVHTTDRAQALGIFRCYPPCRHQCIEIGDFILEFLQENFADFVVDFFAH